MISKFVLSHLLCIFVILLSINGINGACDATRFECDNGSCIYLYEVCNGVKNCPDGSDETGIVCVSQRQHCTKPYFQCSYGACVIGSAACNGVQDCADGSDETVLRCGTEDDVREFDRRQQGNCQVNEIKCPSGICIDKYRFLCNGQDDCGDGSGFDESVTFCGHLECPLYSFKCGSGSCISNQLVCNNRNDCFDGTDEAPLLCNTTSVPKTPAKDHVALPDQFGCPLLSNGYSTRATCFYSGKQVDCSQSYHPPGTVVKFVCVTGFYKATRLPDMICLPSGQWDRERERCDQDCGRIATPIQRFSFYGYPTINTVVPWHVGLFSDVNEKGVNYLCGGSLLTPDLVITAAHCVFNEAVFEAYPKDIFQVVASKLYRDYGNVPNVDYSRRVNQIIVAPGYRGTQNNFVNDVALIILNEPYALCNSIQPVCVHFFAENEIVNNNVQGKFAAWNYEGKRELQFVLAESQMNAHCAQKIRNLGTDKFCIETLGNSLACRGDSGGGFTAERKTSASSRHYLYGVISDSPNIGQCTLGPTTLTNIQHFDGFIQNAIRNSEENRS